MDLPKLFEDFLREQGKVSEKTLRNYRSDLAHFLRWAKTHLGRSGIGMDQPTKILPHFTPSLVGTYKGYNLELEVPHATINRRLSTLRSFARFLTIRRLLDNNPTENIQNILPIAFGATKESLLEDFKRELEVNNLSKSTLKNYLSDIRHFLNWLEDPKPTTGEINVKIQEGGH
ncbi:MAG: hypothetical protein A2700_02035 [Candidatus Blackburnbacteria bacterium RIFCSPHIGHO2_01_FULL_44_64]|uniref:Core-binding (CB) domain-containing protein n=1 Tax=Candidatus Blackburnbacteria bacterium RIFCSPHIGHO2_02_FULL_44_20 TaxID=1797516 RepID=A0A1G1VA52_9BACT|nr:MAG: hypothetical protein A2700_02035 [Candidatus Blackburnbacteria bacterium RIFCSPHIGHO2_01_FULL_44_64]OGY10485.1 MAG: hypothetical protein A3E16_04310 [Candidatus Blackburnbacteria bacterium RIFCSPHIGHO2_12_FULL_44_25]OGY12243.1 MAG: hypothetical protein A3D26_02220 [Candidatus Blackburnbacteria bacterium RIFCSPHIGHO2_02_FULL_44_20]OGY15118.1 MAG: hypothetical protein A3A62_00235 [Candidatus Blackburnbacteria bacterium RIFCSPLOWO2_01_FULL_44_43]OGY15235.1 MAG: hypothetical protein A3H88_0